MHAVCRGVPTDNSLLYLPTEEDLRVICLEHYTKRSNFFDDVPTFSLSESNGKASLVDNLQFNVEFAKLTGTEINLSNKQKKQLGSMRDGTLPLSILEDDLQVKLDD